MSYELIRGDATQLPLADDSVDLIVTSPPYFALRSYTDRCPDCGGSGSVRPASHGTKECPQCGRRAKVLGVDKPKPVPDGQLDMFGDSA